MANTSGYSATGNPTVGQVANAVLNQHANTILGAFASDSYISNSLDIQHEPVYDSFTLVAGALVNNQTAVWFSNITGALKTPAQTSMTTSNRLDAPQSHSIQSIKLRWSENILAADALTVMNGFAFNFVIATKSFNLAPIWQYPAGGGIYAPSTTVNNTSWIANGEATRTAQLRLALPIVIGNQLSFSASLLGNQITLTGSGSGGTGLTMWCSLDGLHARAVL